MYERDGELLGFYLPEFGEGPITARTEQAGIELLGLKIQDCRRVVVPSENSAAAEFLRDCGYREEKRIPRMIRGRQFPWKPEWNYARIGGFAG